MLFYVEPVDKQGNRHRAGDFHRTLNGRQPLRVIGVIQVFFKSFEVNIRLFTVFEVFDHLFMPRSVNAPETSEGPLDEISDGRIGIGDHIHEGRNGLGIFHFSQRHGGVLPDLGIIAFQPLNYAC